jgi:putative transcriptional regulator
MMTCVKRRNSFPRRKRLLATFLGISIDTLRSWEQGKRAPQPIAQRFLSEIESDPGYWRQRL